MTTSSTYVFIVNPRSAAGATLRRFERVRQRFTERLGDVEVQLTNAPRHATELSRAAVRAGAKAVISVGGDGTNNEVVNGFFDERGARLSNADTTAFGVVTSGTGGDFRRTFGWSTEPLEDLERLARFTTRPLDVGTVTFADGRRFVFVNEGSFGMSGQVTDVVNNSSKMLGAKLSFMTGSLRTMLTYQPRRVRLTLSDGAREQVVEDDTTLVAFSNGQYFGGGMWIAPGAKPDDGKLECVVVSGGGLALWLRHGMKIYSGKHTSLPFVRILPCTKAVAEAVGGGAPILVEIDGEQPGQLPATFEVVPAAVRLLV